MTDKNEPGQLDEGTASLEDEEIIQLTDVVEEPAAEDEEITEVSEVIEGTSGDEGKMVETTDWVTDASDETKEIPDLDEALSFDHALDEDLGTDEDEDDFFDALGMDLDSGPAISEAPPEVSIEAEPAGGDVSESITVSTGQLEEALERVIEKMLSAKIERILSEVIEKAVTKEMEKLKGILLDNEGRKA
ncbi:MAG: hypothetical protein JRI99_02150 [Deltaproteobacteria bacterium]|nr:hypothetical protein [Deltaproteobacteria bacterium]